MPWASQVLFCELEFGFFGLLALAVLGRAAGLLGGFCAPASLWYQRSIVQPHRRQKEAVKDDATLKCC